MEKELNSQVKYDQGELMNDVNEDYDKFIQNPRINDFMNNYYYNMPI